MYIYKSLSIVCSKLKSILAICLTFTFYMVLIHIVFMKRITLEKQNLQILLFKSVLELSKLSLKYLVTK